MGWLQALKKSFFGENKPEELLDKGVAKTAKELLLGKDSKTSKVGGAASGGEVFHDNATHLKMFGGRDIDIIPSRNGAILQVSGVGPKDKGGFSISMDKEEFAKFKALDKTHQTMFIENFLGKYAPNKFKELSGNKNVANYWSQVGEKKFYVPVTAGELNKLKSLSGQEKNDYFKELLNEKNPQQYKAMINAEKAVAADKKIRDVAQTPWQRDGSTTQRSNSQDGPAWGKRFKQYPDEPLNPRISKVTPFVDENTIYLNMTVDDKEKNLTVSNKNTVDAFNAGALPLNVLANKVLSVAENLQVDLQSRFSMALDAQRSQDMSQSQGFHR